MLAAVLFPVLALVATQSIAVPVLDAREDVTYSAAISSPSNTTSGFEADSCGRRHRNGTRHHRRPRPSGVTSVVLPSSSASADVETVTSASASASASDVISPIEASSTSVIGDNNNAVVSSSAVTSTAISSIESEVVSTSTESTSTTPTSTEASSAAASATSTSAATTGDDFADEMLKLHNDFRAQYGAVALTWNTDLASFAQSWAGNCKFEHSSGSGYGENLAAGVGGGYDAASGFQSWADEASAYDYNNPGFSEATGHFTQVVWKGTTELGCAFVDCPNGSIFSSSYGATNKFLSCNYKAPGNYQGEFPENVGEKV